MRTETRHVNDWHSSWKIIKGSIHVSYNDNFSYYVSLTKSFQSLGVTIITAVTVVIFVQMSAISFIFC